MTRKIDWYDELVIITKGKNKGRIGYVDDCDDRGWIICFGDPLLVPNYDALRHSSFKKAKLPDLVDRFSRIGSITTSEDPDIRLDIALEMLLIQNYIWEQEKMLINLINSSSGNVFISHSSKDKPFVRQLSLDLLEHNIICWLDEIDIVAGDSIPEKISNALDKCRSIVVVLSPDSVESGWVRKEWESILWDEIGKKKKKVIPLLYRKCEIPILLKTKKYADFTKSYSHGMEELIRSMGHNKLA